VRCYTGPTGGAGSLDAVSPILPSRSQPITTMGRRFGQSGPGFISLVLCSLMQRFGCLRQGTRESVLYYCAQLVEEVVMSIILVDKERARDTAVGSECAALRLRSGDTWYCSRTCSDAGRHVNTDERIARGLYPFHKN
jgi:hypothetical protein